MAWNDPRPMSPHLQIYKLPFSAKLSIMHRGTGAVLLAGLILMVLVLLSIAGGPESWASMQSFLSGFIGKFILFGFTFCIYYHTCNGIRHLFSDMGMGLEIKDSNRSGIIVIAVSVFLTLLTWIIA